MTNYPEIASQKQLEELIKAKIFELMTLAGPLRPKYNPDSGFAGPFKDALVEYTFELIKGVREMSKQEALARDALGEAIVCEASVQQLMHEFGYSRIEAVSYMWEIENLGESK